MLTSMRKSPLTRAAGGLAFGIVLAAFALLAAGCGSRPPLTASEVRGECLSASSGGERDCGAPSSYCAAIDRVVTSRYASLGDCRQACFDAGKGYDMGFKGCSRAISLVRNWCLKFCNTNYPHTGGGS